MDSEEDAVEARSVSIRMAGCLGKPDPISSFPVAAPPGKKGVEEGFRPGLRIIVQEQESENKETKKGGISLIDLQRWVTTPCVILTDGSHKPSISALSSHTEKTVRKLLRMSPAVRGDGVEERKRANNQLWRDGQLSAVNSSTELRPPAPMTMNHVHHKDGWKTIVLYNE